MLTPALTSRVQQHAINTTAFIIVVLNKRKREARKYQDHTAQPSGCVLFAPPAVVTIGLSSRAHKR